MRKTNKQIYFTFYTKLQRRALLNLSVTASKQENDYIIILSKEINEAPIEIEHYAVNDKNARKFPSIFVQLKSRSGNIIGATRVQT